MVLVGGGGGGGGGGAFGAGSGGRVPELDPHELFAELFPLLVLALRRLEGMVDNVPM